MAALQQPPRRPDCSRLKLFEKLIAHGADLGDGPLQGTMLPPVFASYGTPEELDLLVRSGMLFTKSPNTDGTFLAAAAGAANTALVDDVLRRGVSSNALDASGCSALNRAAAGYKQGRQFVFKSLLARKADPNLQCRIGAPLHTLLRFPGADGKGLVVLLLQNGADPHLGLKWSENMTPLESAVDSSGSAREILDVVVAAGAKLTPRLGRLVASSYGRDAPAWVDFLADNRYDLDQAYPDHGETMLMMALRRGHLRTAEALLRRGSDPRIRPETPPSLIDGIRGHASVLHALPPKDDDAVRALELLRPYELDFNANGTYETRPLLALQNPYSMPKTIALLIRLGAHVKATDRFGEGVVHRIVANIDLFSAKPPDMETVRIVLNAGADVNLQDRYGRAPIMSAARRNPHVVAELIKLGARVDVHDQNGIKPLHIAAFKADPNTVKLLLDRGANKEAKTTFGDRACDSAFFGIQHARVRRGTNFQIDNHRETLRLLCPSDLVDGWKQAAPQDQESLSMIEQRSRRYQGFR